MLNLLCYVRGDKSQQTFEVEIDEAKSVGTLKEYIKEKNKPRFDHIPAFLLDLWNKPVPINSILKGTVDALQLVVDDSLYSQEILSDVLPSRLEKGTVYIIIDRPPGEWLIIYYLIISGTDAMVSFSPALSLRSTMTISLLQLQPKKALCLSRCHGLHLRVSIDALYLSVFFPVEYSTC